MALDAGLLPALVALLRSGPPKLREPVTFHLSNIASGTPPQLRRLIDAGAYPPVLRLLSNATEGQVATNCAYTIVNALQGGGATIAAELVTLGAVAPLVATMGKSSRAADVVRLAVDALRLILDAEGASPLGAIEAKHTAAAVAAGAAPALEAVAARWARRATARPTRARRRPTPTRCCEALPIRVLRVGARTPRRSRDARARACTHGHAACLRRLAAADGGAAAAVGAAVGRRGAHHTHPRGGARPRRMRRGAPPEWRPPQARRRASEGTRWR